MAVGLQVVQVAVQVQEKMEAKRLGFGAEIRSTNSSRTAGMGRTRGVGPRV